SQRRSTVLKCLSSSEKGKVEISCDLMDSEAFWCARHILEVLRASGFPAKEWQFSGSSATLALRDVGITIIVVDFSHVPVHVQNIADCFAKVGLPMNIKTPDKPNLMPESDSAIIWVGRKP